MLADASEPRRTRERESRQPVERANEKDGMDHHSAPAPAPKKKPTRSAAPKKASRKRTGPDTSRDPRETPLSKRDLEVTLARFLDTIEHPVQRAIAPHAIHAIVMFGEIHRRTSRSLTFGWIDPQLAIEATPIDDEHPAELASFYFAVLAAFYRFRASEGALDREAADRIAGVYLQASISLANIDESPQKRGRS
jgi:hypothetical protein